MYFAVCPSDGRRVVTEGAVLATVEGAVLATEEGAVLATMEGAAGIHEGTDDGRGCAGDGEMGWAGCEANF